tara:strand:+ start:63 stop:260 length:198 start_codon:yes stop_codon:yes gene_type:complete
MKKLISLGVLLGIIIVGAYFLQPYAFGYTENLPIEVKKEVCEKPKDTTYIDTIKPIDLNVPKIEL